MIHAGMKSLTIAVLVVAGLAAACGRLNTTASQPAGSGATSPGLHVVQQGETYELIAARNQIDVSALLEANALTSDAPLRAGQPLVIPAQASPAPGSAPSAAGEGTSPDSSPAPLAPKPLSEEWRAAQLERARALIDDIRAREGGIFFLGGAGLVGGLLALQVLIWLAREIVLTCALVGRKLGPVGHDLGLNVWYAALWLGLLFWIPSRALWRVLRPAVQPRARAAGRFALQHGTTWSRRGARWAQAQGKRAAIAIRDEAIDALEELALKRPTLRGISEKVQGLAYKESRAMRSRLPSAHAEAWPPTEQELLDALGDGSLSVQFGPLLDMTALTVAAVESSLSWERAATGPVPANRLGAVLERPGYTRVQRALLERTLRDACARLETSSDDPPRLVAVSIGRSQFFDPTLFATLRTVLQESGAAAAGLELGIDERTVLSDLAAAGEVLARLRETGVRMNLHEFGALTAEQLRDLPVSGVTVDFWNSRHDERIEAYVVESVRTARAAGLPVTAARAETPSEIEFARSLGCERLASAGPARLPATDLDISDDTEIRTAASAAA